MASTRGVQLTRQGKERLEEELRLLLKEKLPQLTQAMQYANEEGDTNEHSEYEDLKEERAYIDNRIREIEYTLEHAILIEEGSKDGTIALGSHIQVQSDDDEEDENWVLVSAEEADSLHGRISDDSPVGQQLLGKRKGDSFTVTTPGGTVAYTVVDVN